MKHFAPLFHIYLALYFVAHIALMIAANMDVVLINIVIAVYLGVFSLLNRD